MTTPIPATIDPVEKLLQLLLEKDDAREDKETERAATLRSIQTALTDMKTEQVRTTGAIREVRDELARQDKQMQLFDERISGNYRGIASRLDDLDEDLKVGNRLIGNLEVAVVAVTTSNRVLHGRMIEHSDIMGGRLKKTEERLGLTEGEIAALDTRVSAAESGVRAIEKRLADGAPPSIEGVASVGGVGGG